MGLENQLPPPSDRDWETKLVRDLNIGAVVDHGVIEPINRQSILQKCISQGKNKAIVDSIRSGRATIQEDRFIKEANENYGH